MADLYMVQGDRRPILAATLTQGGEAINLTGASGVVFRGRLQNGTTVFTGSCSIVSAAAGTVTYTWGASDTATPGIYIVEFVITWSTGVTQSIPSHRTRTLEIRDTAA